MRSRTSTGSPRVLSSLLVSSWLWQEFLWPRLRPLEPRTPRPHSGVECSFGRGRFLPIPLRIDHTPLPSGIFVSPDDNDLSLKRAHMTSTPDALSQAHPGMLWLDLTRQCQLTCTHCYNQSGPTGGHGTMSRNDWLRIVDQAANTGTRHVQLIGGEPTLHPNAQEIAARALDHGLNVEVYSNLVHVTPTWWELLQRPGMSLATSYYGSTPDRHGAMTGRPSSHRHTRANIIRALDLRVTLRVSIITPDGEGVDETRAELEQLGVTRIGVDRVRPYGRGARGREPDCSGLCGACGDNRASVSPDGTVSPCVFSTWMNVGNIREQPLADILTGSGMLQARNTITAGKKDPPPNPIPCGPDRWCSPGVPDSGCTPRR